MLEHDTRHDQSELVLFASLREIGHAEPELVHGEVEFVYRDHQVDEKAIGDLL